MSEESKGEESKGEDKPKILVLHGFGQTSEIIQKRGRNLFKTLSRDYDLYFPEAPYDVILQKLNESDNSFKYQQGKAWFYYNPENPSDFKDYLNKKETQWYGVEDSIYFDANNGSIERLSDRNANNLLNYIIKNGPFYAVIGFSQGAHLIPLLYNTINEGHYILNEYPNEKQEFYIFTLIEQFKKLIFISGFKTPMPLHISLHGDIAIDYPEQIDIPTLHIYGQEDEFISNEKSNELVEICKNPIVHIHNKGHILAQDSESKKKILQFLQN